MWRILIGAFLALAAQPALAWRVAESDHFRIYSDAGLARLKSDAAALEDYHRLLLLLTGKPWPADAPKLDIYMLDGQREMQIFLPSAHENLAGVYMATNGGIMALSENGSSSAEAWNSGRQTLLHEYAHHFMAQVGKGVTPAWYVEGFAEYLMTSTFRPDKVEFGKLNMGRAYSLSQPNWLSMEELLTGGGKRADVDKFYAQSWLLTHYMFRGPGMAPKLKDYLTRVGNGENSVDAFKAAVNPDLKAFQRELRRYMMSDKITYSYFKREPEAAHQISISELPEAAENILLPLASMTLPQKKETDERNLKRVRDAAARFPEDSYAQKSLAIAEAISGDRELAARKLDELLAKSPNDVEMLRWRADLIIRGDDISSADRLKARRLLASAFKIAPNDWQVLLAYVETFETEEGKLPPKVLDVLLKAHILAPQVDGVAVQAGMQLANAGEYQLAYQTLAPAMLNPHKTGETSVENLLAALKTGDKGKVDAAFEAMRKTNEPQVEAPVPPTPAPTPTKE